jgi:two-component system, sensor histidine kinase and response regulator
MPGTDGFAVCARVRSLPGGADVPVVFLTAQRDLDTFEQALRAGGDDFVTKPVRPAELVLRVQAALKLRRTSVELRDYYELVRRQRDDLMRLTLQKERLTSFVVHDLKNPVNSMDLIAQLLLRNQALPTDVRERVQQLRSELRGLLRLVLNLLDISKSEEGLLAPVCSKIPLRAFLSEIGEAFSAGARSSGVDLRYDVEVETLEGDPDLLRRVIENLLDNALRHAPGGSLISLCAHQEDGSVVLRVADQGKGIPAELREKIFERFVQVDQPQGSMTRSGRGLGLTFCKLAVEAHGGSIAVEEGNPGAVFCIRLPAAR